VYVLGNRPENTGIWSRYPAGAREVPSFHWVKLSCGAPDSLFPRR